MNYLNMNNKIAIVTGGTKGIGKAIVKKLLQLKVRVAVTYSKDDESAQKVEKELKRFKNNFFIIKFDVSNIKNIDNLYDTVENFWSNKINFLVNNAGVLKQGNFYNIGEKEWNWIMDINLKGPFFLSQKFLKRYNKGSIVNISSIGGQIGGDKAPHYAISKAGIISLTKSLARLGSSKNIRVNTVSPGWIETEIFNEEQLKTLQKKAKNTILLKRLGKPEEVASSVVFLLSDEATYITGQCINVNGGMYFG